MREFKDSGIEWIGKIPETWEVCKLNYIYRFQTGATPPSKVELYFDGDIKWANISDLKTQYVYDTNKHLSEEGVAKCNMNISPKGSLMYSFKLSVGAVAFCGCDMYTNEAIASFLQGYGNLHYLYYMSQVAIINNANYNIYGAPILNQDLIQNAIVINPPLPEQQRIADYLDEKCGEIDSLISLQEQMIEKLKAYKQSVITEAATKGLDLNAKLVPSGIDWIGDIPEGWLITDIKNLCISITDGSHFSPERQSEGMPYITAGDIRGKGIDYNNAMRIRLEDYNTLESQGCRPHKGDVLMVKDGATTGRVGMMTDDEKCVLLSSVAMLTPLSKVDSNYLMYLVQSNVIQAQIQLLMAGSAMPRVTLKKINSLKGLLIPLNTQRSIASYLDEKCADIDRLIALKQQKIESLKDYKKSVIYEAVTGKTIIE